MIIIFDLDKLNIFEISALICELETAHNFKNKRSNYMKCNTCALCGVVVELNSTDICEEKVNIAISKLKTHLAKE